MLQPLILKQSTTTSKSWNVSKLIAVAALILLSCAYGSHFRWSLPSENERPVSVNLRPLVVGMALTCGKVSQGQPTCELSCPSTHSLQCEWTSMCDGRTCNELVPDSLQLEDRTCSAIDGKSAEDERCCTCQANISLPSKDTPQNGALPIPAEVYQGSTSGCPFQQWFGGSLKANPDFGKWEQMFIETSKASWEEKKKVVGWELDDHIVLNTPLGQGPSLGFVTASISIDPSALPADAQVGLFDKAQTIDSVVRFSGFGGDGPLKLSRMAVKMNYPEAWYGEINWLFTETLPVFVMDNFNDVKASAEGNSWTQFKGLMKASWSSFGQIMHYIWTEKVKGNPSEIPEKQFFSQLPYALGEKYAMKMEMRPGISPEGCPMEGGTTGKWEADRAAGLSKALKTCDTTFDLYLRVLERSTHEELINKKATQAWTDASIYKVGSLTIPVQNLDLSTGQSEKLQSWLDSKFHLGSNKENAHKLFRFHPIATIEEHQPLGEVNTFRAGFYSQHAKLRSETLQQGLGDAHKFPFGTDFSKQFGENF